MKKLILACASLLAFSGVAVGETVENADGNITYTVGVSSTNGKVPTHTSKYTSTSDLSGDGKINVTIENNDKYDGYRITYNCIPYSIDNSLIEVELSNIQVLLQTSNDPDIEYRWNHRDEFWQKVDDCDEKIITVDELNDYVSTLSSSANYSKYIDGIQYIKNNTENNDECSLLKGNEFTTDSKNKTYSEYGPYENLYYYKSGSGTTKKPYVYNEITQIDLVIYSSQTYTNSYAIYSPKSIPSSTSLFVNNKNIQTVKIGKTITSIEAGAFAGATKLTTFSTESTSFVVDDNGLLYTAGYAALVAVPAGKDSKDGTITNIKLHDNCSSIYDYACANVSNVNLISTRTSVSYTTLGGSGNKVTVASATLTINTANGGVTATANQVLTQDNVNAIISSKGSGRFINLSGCVKPEATLTISGLGANCLLFLPAGTKYTASNDENIVIGTICENFVMTDGTDFFSPKTFTAKRVEYQRTFKETWGTLCLPFNVPEALVGNFNNVYQFAYMSDYNASKNTFQFTLNQNSEALLANTPYVFKRKTDKTDIRIFNDNKDDGKYVTVNETSPLNASFNGSTFHAAFTASTYTSNSSTNYYGFASGNLVRLTGANVPAFRCYISAPVAAAAPEMRFVDEDGFDVDFSDNETEIEAIEEVNTDAAIYNVNGQQVSEMTSGMYIVNGKKVTVK